MRKIFLFSLFAIVNVSAGAWAGVTTTPAGAAVEPVSAATRPGTVASAQTPTAKASPTRNIDTAAERALPVENQRARYSPVSNAGLGKADGSHMKCWQNGRLIVDKRVKVLPAEAANASRVRDAETDAEVLTFDLKNALCVVQ